MSRHAAKRAVTGADVRRSLESKGIVVRCHSDAGLAEEAPQAYKDIESVVEVVENAGLSTRVARLKPVAVIKGE
jgi:tRNA-splicing ligase RtcB